MEFPESPLEVDSEDSPLEVVPDSVGDFPVVQGSEEDLEVDPVVAKFSDT